VSDAGKGEQREAADETVAISRGWRVITFEKLANPPAWLAAGVYAVAALGILFVLYMLSLGLIAFFKLGHEIAFAPTTAPAPSVGTAVSRSDGAGSLTIFFTVLGALIGGPLLIWRVITAHIQAQAARHQADTGREAHYTTLFTKAVEQLGATRDESDGAGQTVTRPNLEVRLGAIYALDRVARDSERDHWPIMQVLCAYVRSPQNCGAPAPPPEGIKSHSEKFRTWLNSIEPPRVDVQAALTVIGERAEGRRELEARRRLQLDLRHANLQGAVLGSRYFEDAIFERAHLDGASFTRAHLDGASFQKAHLAGASFEGARLDGTLFLGAHLAGASFYVAHLDAASFGGADLDGASFDAAHLDAASFHEAHLAGASFHGAHLDRTFFLGAHLDGASFFNVDLSKARSLDPAMLASAFGDASTRLPDEKERPAAWPHRKLSKEKRREWIKTSRDTRPKET
jgi:uncharacterized protein YjbI with pentapeptide repeats